VPQVEWAESYDALRRQTAPGLLALRARETPRQIAYRVKKLGIYRERDWAAFRDLVASAAFGLRALGVEAGTRVAIMGDACEEWVICDLAAQALGAITYGIYPTASASEVAYQMRDGGARVFIAEDQEYIDKILPLLDTLPELEAVVAIDATAMFAYEHEKLHTFAELQDRGAKATAADFDALVAALDPASPAFIVYTSGTTGSPKGALVAHGKHLAAAATLVRHFPMLGTRPHRTVAYLPLCHIMGRDIAITLPLMTRIVPHFGEDLESLPETLFEVAPTVLLTVPRYLQKFASQILVAIEETTPVKRRVYASAMALARGIVQRRWAKRRRPGDAALAWLLRQAAFRPILNKIGFDRLELVLSGGAPLPAATMALWQVYGVNVAEIYGQTETAGAIITAQADPFPRPGDVGTPPEGWAVRLSETGEILVQGADLFEGYWGLADETAALFDDDGWLGTGDVGVWENGRLRIVDRARDIIVTTGGKSLSPTPIENALRASPYISEAIVFGDGRKYVTALIEIDHETVAGWARARNLAYGGFTALTMLDEVRALIAAEVERANAELARVEQIKDFRILPKVLDPEEEGEPVTPTRKVKRKVMYERFADLIEAMYRDDEAARQAAEVADLLGASDGASPGVPAGG